MAVGRMIPIGELTNSGFLRIVDLTVELAVGGITFVTTIKVVVWCCVLPASTEQRIHLLPVTALRGCLQVECGRWRFIITMSRAVTGQRLHKFAVAIFCFIITS